MGKAMKDEKPYYYIVMVAHGKKPAYFTGWDEKRNITGLRSANFTPNFDMARKWDYNPHDVFQDLKDTNVTEWSPEYEAWRKSLEIGVYLILQTHGGMVAEVWTATKYL